MKFKYEWPSLKRKEEAQEYVIEHLNTNSKINGTGGLNKQYEEYEEWLDKTNKNRNIEVSEEVVPSDTYFLVRCDDDRIVGMVNIRKLLTEELKRHGGNIGYGIRPSERGKGYNKINLYLALKVCDKYNIEEVLLDALSSNVASWKTMEALGGKRIKEFIDNGNELYKYSINVKESLNKFKDQYEPLIEGIYE